MGGRWAGEGGPLDAHPGSVTWLTLTSVKEAVSEHVVLRVPVSESELALKNITGKIRQ